ncbi:MAG: hypothetical protein ACTHMS_17585 [Jatrophihabitans sp.]|uniref:hypothetical protein n=1 Tax=Jatrophihabitans sp. TaxID=1932789 RepID=UPI003F813141
MRIAGGGVDDLGRVLGCEIPAVLGVDHRATSVDPSGAQRLGDGGQLGEHRCRLDLDPSGGSAQHQGGADLVGGQLEQLVGPQRFLAVQRHRIAPCELGHGRPHPRLRMRELPGLEHDQLDEVWVVDRPEIQRLEQRAERAAERRLVRTSRQPPVAGHARRLGRPSDRNVRKMAPPEKILKEISKHRRASSDLHPRRADD